MGAGLVGTTVLFIVHAIMRTLSRLLLLILCAALLIATWGLYTETTRGSYFHETWYTLRYPGLRDVRQWSLWGDLAWCIIFVRRDPVLVRVGLIAIALSFAIMAMPPRALEHVAIPRLSGVHL
jgi:hypothetical protein